MYEEKLKFSRSVATEGIVLLKNEDNVLPIFKNEKVAVFGRGQIDTFKCGCGAADVYAPKVVSIIEGIKNNGILYYEPLKKLYSEFSQNDSYDRNWYRYSVTDYPEKAIHYFKEADISEKIISDAARECSKAIFVISRGGGENVDLKNEKADFIISDEEEELMKKVYKYFSDVILIFNTPSVMDISFLKKYNPKAILAAFFGGQETGNAVAEILSGKINPSGKLADSWAEKYEDYPSSDNFGTQDVVYKEGIYVGYKYFDTFNKAPVFPFGFGLSYTNFEIKNTKVSIEKNNVVVCATVENTGECQGKEVVQCYISIPDSKLEKPYQQLCGFHKTKLLSSGEKENIKISFDLRDFSSFDEKNSRYILEEGKYIIRVGNSSRNTHILGVVILKKDYVISEVCHFANPEAEFFGLDEIKVLSKTGYQPYSYENESAEFLSAPEIVIENIEKKECFYKDNIEFPDISEKTYFFEDVLQNRVSADIFISQFTDKELCLFVNGDDFNPENKEIESYRRAKKYGRFVPWAGGQTCAFDKYRLPSIIVADGPTGLRLSGFTKDDKGNFTFSDYAKDCISYPSPTLVACTWNTEISEKLGKTIFLDYEKYDVDGWLSPGVNIHRNPLNGRNFEYFSEDFLLTSKIAAAEIRGFQTDENGRFSGKFATIKHLVGNEQETLRFKTNSIIPERALREIYLKPFELAIKESQPLAIMTSYNKINGTYSPSNAGLLKGIVRGEWGYRGLIMSDWCSFSKVDTLPNAGNDINMPGEPLDERKVTYGVINREDIRKCALNILNLIVKIYKAKEEKNETD